MPEPLNTAVCIGFSAGDVSPGSLPKRNCASLTDLKLKRDPLIVRGSNDGYVRGDSFDELLVDTLERRFDSEGRD
jgi:hypothetical protein